MRVSTSGSSHQFAGRQGRQTADRGFRGRARALTIFSTVMLALAAGLCAAVGRAAKDSVGKVELKSPAFAPGGTIPVQFTCSGADISPPLAWSPPPQGTRTFALIMDDPDAPGGTWSHWVVYNLLPSTRQLPQAAPQGDTIAGGGEQGLNDFHKIGYGGPCPPPGKPHRYFFRIYALDTMLDLLAPAQRKDILASMKDHLLAQGELMGTFGR